MTRRTWFWLAVAASCGTLTVATASQTGAQTNGKLAEQARATVSQNGILIHQSQDFKGPTGINYRQYKDEAPTGPVILQGDHDTVKFRNIWIVPAKY